MFLLKNQVTKNFLLLCLFYLSQNMLNILYTAFLHSTIVITVNDNIILLSLLSNDFQIMMIYIVI